VNAIDTDNKETAFLQLSTHIFLQLETWRNCDVKYALYDRMLNAVWCHKIPLSFVWYTIWYLFTAIGFPTRESAVCNVSLIPIKLYDYICPLPFHWYMTLMDNYAVLAC